MKNQRIKFLITTAGLLAIVISAPVAVAAMLIKAASSASLPADGLQVVQAPAASTPESSTPPAAPANPLIAGMLYTNGPVKVDWQGVNIPVQNSSYAYTGGELVSTSPTGMGILQLGRGGGTVFICPGSKVRLSRDDSGQITVDVVAGKSRFEFPAGKPFQVRVNDTVLTPDSAAPSVPDAPQPAVVAGEVESTKNGGCLLCGLKNNLKVSNPGGAAEGGSLSALAGQIVTVPGAAAPGKPSVLDLPDTVRATLQAGLGSGGQGAGFLCKCGELKKYAVELAALLERQTAEPSAPDAEGQTSELVRVVDTPAPPDPAPPVQPPELPGFVLAETGPPDPFVPGLIPAAGEENAGPPADTPVVIVPPPFVPGSGPGGGAVVSPS